jgi:hypothetical protein
VKISDLFKLEQVYSWDFAQSVVNKWTERNARASVFLSEHLGVSGYMLMIFLTRGSPLWDASKRMSKDFLRWEVDALGLATEYKLPLPEHLLSEWLNSASESVQNTYKELAEGLDMRQD